MCGRYTYLFTWEQLHRLMELAGRPDGALVPRYNVAPTQTAPVVRQGADGQRMAAMLRWGLVPSWADDPSVGGRLINARGETLAEKPAFRTAFARRRCLVPVSGFYEWKTPAGNSPKQPYWIGRADRGPFALAGIWEFWSRGDQSVESFAIITTTPNRLMAPLHDRMPVIIEPGEYGRWLGSVEKEAAGLSALIRPADDTGFVAYPVRTRVNSPKNDDPSLIERSEPESQGLF